MAKIRGRPVIHVKLCEVFGLEPNDCLGVNLNTPLDGSVTVDFRMVMRDEQGNRLLDDEGIVTHLKTFTERDGLLQERMRAYIDECCGPDLIAPCESCQTRLQKLAGYGAARG